MFKSTLVLVLVLLTILAVAKQDNVPNGHAYGRPDNADETGKSEKPTQFVNPAGNTAVRGG